MPKRVEPIIDKHFYHVYNRGIDHQPTFLSQTDYSRFIQLLDFYRWPNHKLRYSSFIKLKPQAKKDYIDFIQQSEFPYVSIISFCLMPNHFHILARQESLPGLQFYLAQVQNSYTRGFNSAHSRDGSLFLTQFKATHIESEHQLMHTSRYIHLNPLTSGLVIDFNHLLDYPWSSLQQYNAHPTNFNFCDTQLILSNFNSRGGYIDSIEARAPYQKHLHYIQHS